MKYFGGKTNSTKHWSDGVKFKDGSYLIRKGKKCYHPYTEIGFVCTYVNGNIIC